MENFRKGEIGW